MSWLAERRWPVGVVVLLVGHVLAMLWFISLAVSDPSVAVEEDYYAKALRWDETMAQQETNRRLGWQLAAHVTPPVVRGGDAVLEAVLSDAAGRPVTGAEVSVEAFAVARSGHILRSRLEEREQGRYQTHLLLRRSGRWELRFVVTRAEERFTAKRREHLVLTRSGRGA